MPDPKQTVDSIRLYLKSQSTTVSAQIVAVAADYSELCRQANFRLRRCMEFLRDGLRGEALSYANTPPPLLDFVSDLQFRELSDWERTCTTLGLARPTRVSMESASNLIEAARQLEPIEELVGKYRYLSLARAELPQRLAVVHQLIAADPHCSLWRREADELTRARVATLRLDTATAIRNGDVKAVDRLIAELDTGLVPASAELRDTLARASVALHEQAAIAFLRGLVPRVRQAIAHMSYDDGRAVFTEWGTAVKESRISVPPDLRQEIVPLARWLDEMDDLRKRERQFGKACGALKRAMDEKATLEEINPLYQTAVAFGFEMPDDVSGPYRRLTEAARRKAKAEKRKQFLITAAMVGAIVIALAGLGYVMYRFGNH
jgi:hypothetical protein